jgi:hypothetical protein
MLIVKKISLKGNTIIEVVTGIFLITFAITLTAGLFSKTMGNSNLYIKHRAICTLDGLVVQNAKEKVLVPEEIDFGDFLIRVSFVPFQEHDSLSVVSYTAIIKSNGKQIYTRKQLKYLQNN